MSEPQGCSICFEHSGITARTASLERDNDTQWKAIDEMREDIKKITWKIAGVVGSISVINSIAIGIIVYFITKG